MGEMSSGEDVSLFFVEKRDDFDGGENWKVLDCII